MVSNMYKPQDISNKILFQIKVIDRPKYSFCGDTDETIDHLLWNWWKTKLFLQELTERFQEMRISLNLNEAFFILGNFPQNTPNRLVFNTCCKILYQYVQRHK